MLWGQNLIKSSSTLDFSPASKMAKVWPWNVEIRFGNGEFYGMSVEKTILSLVVVVVVVIIIIIIIIIILYLPILLLELA